MDQPVAPLPGWTSYQSHVFGIEISFNVPTAWTPQVDPLVGQLTWLKKVDAGPGIAPMNVQRQEADGKTLDDFTEFSIEQHKQMYPGAPLKVAKTTLGGLVAAKTFHTVPIEELKTNGTTFQTWAKAGNFIFVVTFVCLEQDFNDEYRAQCNIILKSFKFGELRQEHVLLKTYQLKSGFRISTPTTWNLIENSGDMTSQIRYTDSGVSKVKIHLEPKLGETNVTEDQAKAFLKEKVPAAEEIKYFPKEQLGPLVGHKFTFTTPGQETQFGMLHVAVHDGEWFNGSVYLLTQCERSKESRAAVDLLERAVASVGIPLDPLDEDDLHLDALFTYENLNFGYGFKFNKNKQKPKAMCAGMKLIPITPSGMCSFPMPEISGTITPMIAAIGDVEANESLPKLADMLTDMIAKETGVPLYSSSPVSISGMDGLKLVYRATGPNVQLTNYTTRTENFLVILRWTVFIHEVEQEQPFVDEVVNSFYYFGPK